MENIKKVPFSLAARLSVPSDKNSEKRIYAIAQERGTLTLTGLAEHMAEHTTSFSSGEILGIVTDAVNCVVEHLLSGYAVELGSLGKFSARVSSEGVDSAESFSTANIRSVGIRFTAGKKAKAKMQAAQFEQVASRELQQKARKEARQAAEEAVKDSGSGGSDGGSGDGGITGGSGQTE